MFSVLATDPKVRGFKPGRGDGHFTARKKITCKYEQKAKLSFHSPIPPAYYQMTAGRIDREL
jgi:hypothetical protein